MSVDTGIQWTDRIGSAVSAIERRTNWSSRLWRCRLFGCTIGLARLVEWSFSGSWCFTFEGKPTSLRYRFRIARAMWQARYWYDWRMKEQEAAS